MIVWSATPKMALFVVSLLGTYVAATAEERVPSDCSRSRAIVSALGVRAPAAHGQEVDRAVTQVDGPETQVRMLKVASHMVYAALQAKKDRFAIGSVLPVVVSASWSPEFASGPMHMDDKDLSATLMVSWDDKDGKLLASAQTKRVECPRETLVTTTRGGLVGRLHTRAEVEAARAGGVQVDIVQLAYVDCRIVINAVRLTRRLYLRREQRFTESETEATAYAIAAALLDCEKVVRRKVRGRDWCKLRSDPWWFALEVMSGRERSE